MGRLPPGCRPLFEEEVEITDVAELLWNAPFPILSHEMKEEPTFVYGNQAAMGLFECTWDDLIGTPSTKSADPEREIQEDRSALLESVKEKGYVDDYEGWRRSFKGTAFKISKSTVFNVESPGGEVVGQAAILRLWEYEDGRQGGPLAAPIEENVAPSDELLKAAEDKVATLAAQVRFLKEEQGLTNADEEVKAAVAQLLDAKEALEKLQK